MTKNRIRISAIAAVMVAMLGAAGWFGYDAWHLKQLDHARTDSVAAARKTVESIFREDLKTVDNARPKWA
ncbi:hypothetical protein ACFXO7_20530, partial [Nocardia tengchongensis]